MGHRDSLQVCDNHSSPICFYGIDCPFCEAEKDFKEQIEKLEGLVEDIDRDYRTIKDEYESLKEDHESLQNNYDSLQEKYNDEDRQLKILYEESRKDE